MSSRQRKFFLKRMIFIRETSRSCNITLVLVQKILTHNWILNYREVYPVLIPRLRWPMSQRFPKVRYHRPPESRSWHQDLLSSFGCWGLNTTPNPISLFFHLPIYVFVVPTVRGVVPTRTRLIFLRAVVSRVRHTISLCQCAHNNPPSQIPPSWRNSR